MISGCSLADLCCCCLEGYRHIRDTFSLIAYALLYIEGAFFSPSALIRKQAQSMEMNASSGELLDATLVNDVAIVMLTNTRALTYSLETRNDY